MQAFDRIGQWGYEELRGQIMEMLAKTLKPKRFTHTLGVESTAVALARLHDESPEKASIAALLHDMAKNRTDEDLLDICRKNAIDLHPNERYISLLHAFAGSVLAREAYPGLPEEIYTAIRYHSTGRPHMSTLEKIIFSADYIEPNRKPFQGLETARERTFADLDKGCILILEQTISYLKEKKQAIHPLTQETLEDLLRGRHSQTV
ncbi:bis(5'-nucleosyl)-tetraphosphatase (symmetrical) YqeK [Bianquea renquensis]|uniref:bis(5'-nucleosyl)-tetraphosphatase (symmetrical) n=1 Tax=Bianquea renquensis TaxID=2763661 RepID=A0A926DQ80_9FIRM|nr:bis(5'-nucleosyl)-tetraphosphatase (symmetrical) YqeK [Bianquea renquensis]MBC8543188.1 bis(5'-nucleosyl)-tetraphosphatase (symmetrical) YqeK [Bianquea renquensis]